MAPAQAGVYAYITSLGQAIVGQSAHVTGSRFGSGMQDLILSMELSMFFVLWLAEWPRVTSRKMPFFIIYGGCLLGAALWCALGVYIHMFEPLPTERTAGWLAFLALGAVTPVLFPLLTKIAFTEGSVSPCDYPKPYIAAGFVAMAYMFAMVTGADISLGGRMPMELWLSPWHSVDGRSYGGEPHGITFDLMSSFPCYRGDSLFTLSTFFLAANGLSISILRRAARDSIAELRPIAWRLCIGVSLMLINCFSMLYLIAVANFSIVRVFDIFHAIQGLVMAAAFFDFRAALRMQDTKSASGHQACTTGSTLNGEKPHVERKKEM